MYKGAGIDRDSGGWEGVDIIEEIVRFEAIMTWAGKREVVCFPTL